MTEQQKPSLERGLTTRNRIGSGFKDYETRLTNKLSGDGHGACTKDKARPFISTLYNKDGIMIMNDNYILIECYISSELTQNQPRN